MKRVPSSKAAAVKKKGSTVAGTTSSVKTATGLNAPPAATAAGSPNSSLNEDHNTTVHSTKQKGDKGTKTAKSGVADGEEKEKDADDVSMDIFNLIRSRGLVGDHRSFEYLLTLLSTLGHGTLALRFALKSILQPLSYDNIIQTEILGLPLDLEEIQESVDNFVEHAQCQEILYYCVANSVAVRRGKLDEDILDSEQPETTERRLGVDSIMNQFNVIREGHIGEIGLDSTALGDALTVDQIRLELFRATFNFLLRHLFFRLENGERTKKLPKGKALKERGSVMYFLDSCARRMNFSSSYVPGDACSSKMEPRKQHILRTTEDGLLHDVINGFGYGARVDGLDTALAVRMADIALLDVLQASVGQAPNQRPPPELVPILTTTLLLPDLIRLRSLIAPWRIPALSKRSAMSAAEYGDVTIIMSFLLSNYKNSLGLSCVRTAKMYVPLELCRAQNPNFGMEGDRMSGGGEGRPLTGPDDAPTVEINIGVEIVSQEPITVPELFARLQFLVHKAQAVVPRHILPNSRSFRQMQPPAAPFDEEVVHILELSNATMAEHLAAFGLAVNPRWADAPQQKLPEEPEGAAVLRALHDDDDLEDHEAPLPKQPPNAPPLAPPSRQTSPIQGQLPAIADSEAPYSFVIATPEDILCLSQNILSRAKKGYVPVELLRMMLALSNDDLVAALSTQIVVREGMQSKADIFLAMKEAIDRAVAHHLAHVTQGLSFQQRQQKHHTHLGDTAEIFGTEGSSYRLPSAIQQGSAGSLPLPSVEAFDGIPLVESMNFTSPFDAASDATSVMDLGALDGAETGAASVFSDLLSRVEVWMALARNAVLSRDDPRQSNDAVATAALELMVRAANTFQEAGSRAFPLRQMLIDDIELRSHVTAWSTALRAKDRLLRSRCSNPAVAATLCCEGPAAAAIAAFAGISLSF